MSTEAKDELARSLIREMHAAALAIGRAQLLSDEIGAGYREGDVDPTLVGTLDDLRSDLKERCALLASDVTWLSPGD